MDSLVVHAGVSQQKSLISDFRKCSCWAAKIQVVDCKESRNVTAETAVIRLQKIQALLTLQLNCSDPLHVLSDSKKCSETTVGKRTQWKPAVFAVKRFAVQIKDESILTY